MTDGLKRMNYQFFKEHVATIVTGVIISVLSLTVIANSAPIIEWFGSDMKVWIGVACAAYGFTVSIVATLMWRDLSAERKQRVGILWQPHKDLLFKIRLRRKGHRLEIDDVVGPYCGACKTYADVVQFVSSDGRRQNYGVYCPECDDIVVDSTNSEEFLTRAARAIAEGRINRGEVTMESGMIEW